MTNFSRVEQSTYREEFLEAYNFYLLQLEKKHLDQAPMCAAKELELMYKHNDEDLFCHREMIAEALEKLAKNS